jgi:cell volume regulation protein A
MDSFSDFFPDLLIAAALLGGAVALAPVAQRLRLPGPAAFLAAGIAVGLIGIAPFDTLRELPLQQIGVVALYAILFQGGLSTGFRAFRANARPIMLLALPGTAATAAGIALVGKLIGLDWSLAILVGVALAPTDPAAVYATLRGGAAQTNARTVLEGESGFNDPVGISFMVVALAALGSDGASFGEGALRLVEELGIGVIGGIVGAGLLLVALRLTTHLENALRGASLLVGAVIVGAGTASIHGSGFLAVYIVGLVISDTWAKQPDAQRAVPEATAAIAEPLLFGLLGAAFAAQVGLDHLWQGLVLTLATVFLVRPPIAFACLAGCGLSRPEKVLTSWGGLKGAVPLLLGAYPALEGLPESLDTASIVLVATAASIVVLGATLRVVANRIPGGGSGNADAGIVSERAEAGG